jgi:peptidoglycan/xylan/chitin deacetylase (PgdA/CDA1 family)
VDVNLFSGARLLQLLGDWVSPGGNRAKLAILLYHRARAAPDPLLPGETDAATFERHMELLRVEFNVLPLGEACARLVRGTLPPRAACVTFDDGYADNEAIALPILKRLGLQATFFVCTGFCEGGIMFNDAVIEAVRRARTGTHDLSSLGLGVHDLLDNKTRQAAFSSLIAQLKYRRVPERRALTEELAHKMESTLPADLMMSPARIRKLHAEGMEIGAHTINHPILATLDDEEARAEIVGGRRRLEEIIEAPVTLFAYPNGKPGRDYGPRDVALVRKAGFAAAVSTAGGAAGRRSDLFQLPRFSPWEPNPRRLGLRLLLSRPSSVRL